MKNIELINASAGSGKTYSLTRKVIDVLKDGCSPESLLATTFTNKAAAELRERIRLALLNDGLGDEARRIPDGFVGTVNGVCARLLSEYAIDAGLSPALDVMPEQDATRLFQIAISSVIDTHADALEPAARRLEYQGGGSGFQRYGDWRDDVRRVVDMARSNMLDGQALNQCATYSWESFAELFGDPLKVDLDAQLARAVADALPQLEAIDEPKGSTRSTTEALKKFVRYRDRGYVIPWSDWVRLSKLSVNKDAEGIVDDVIRIAGQVLKHPQFQTDVRQMIEGVFLCATEALEAYELFKRQQGLMDFVDQESRVLDLALSHEAFRASMRERLQQMMVDEFQDTSPVQLALFLAFNELAGQSVWVGDPKQAIYGFRGTDPGLMEEVVKRIETHQTLNYSWRSRASLVAFSNAVFEKVFHHMGAELVRLEVPEQRSEKAKGGWVESWHLNVKNAADEASAIANGVKDLLIRRGDIKPGDIAILCRKNDQCSAIAANLEAMGIRASAAQGSLLETRECQLAVAALRYLQDRRDTIALTEIVHLSPFHSAYGQWLQTLVLEKGDALERWKQDPLIAGLDAARKELADLTPLEALELAIDKVDLLRTVRSWSGSELRMANLDQLRGACLEYMDECRARRSAATLGGFIPWLYEAEPSMAEGYGDQTVQILTYHKSKGLEWPIVILTSLDNGSRGNVFGNHMVPAKSFDPTLPLANRSIRFWPWPFGAQKGMDAIDEALAGHQEKLRLDEEARSESHRLMYVGMTRARDGMVFAMRRQVSSKGVASLKCAWMDELVDSEGHPVLDWPFETGEQTIKIGSYDLAIQIRQFDAEDDGRSLPGSSENVEFMPAPAVMVPEFLPARVSPSSIDASDTSPVSAQCLADFGHRITLKGKPDMSQLGQAIHGFLAVDDPDSEMRSREDMAVGLLKRWDVEDAVAASDLPAISNRLHAYIRSAYPNAKVYSEWPITLRNESNQLLQGWVDMLLEIPEGYVVIDHKSYPGSDVEEQVQKFVGQLSAYKQAVELATGKPLLNSLIHLPISGQVLALNV